jgi:hypothetical protein
VGTIKSKLQGVWIIGDGWSEMEESRDGPVIMLRVPVDSAAFASRARSSSVFSSMVGEAREVAESGVGGTMKTFEPESTSTM